MEIVSVFDVNKVANEPSGPFAKVRAPQADNDSINPYEFFSQKRFSDWMFDWNTPYSYQKLFN